MSRKRTRLLLALGAAVGLAGLAAAVPAWRGLRDLGQGSAPSTVPVKRGDFVRRIHAEGNLEAAQATLLGPPADMQEPLKIAWLAPDGSPVKQGDVVIRFDPTDLEKNLADGRSDRAIVESRITHTSVRATSTQHNLELDAGQAGHELEYARRFPTADPEIFSRTEIIESEIDEGLALARKQHAEGVRETRRGLARTDVDLLAIERRKADFKIQRAEKGLQALEVRAPHDGIFTLKEQWGDIPEVGQVVWGGNRVAELPQQDEMEARLFILEADAGGLREGLPALLTVEARPQIAYEATVGKVDALAKRRNFRVPIQYFGATLKLARTDPEVMKLGQRVRAVITLDERKDVLTVPRQAVFEHEGKTVVHRERRGALEPVEVKLGPAALGIVVIEHGLDEGDRIALWDPKSAPAARGVSTEGGEASGPVRGGPGPGR